MYSSGPTSSDPIERAPLFPGAPVAPAEPLATREHTPEERRVPHALQRRPPGLDPCLALASWASLSPHAPYCVAGITRSNAASHRLKYRQRFGHSAWCFAHPAAAAGHRFRSIEHRRATLRERADRRPQIEVNRLTVPRQEVRQLGQRSLRSTHRENDEPPQREQIQRVPGGCVGLWTLREDGSLWPRSLSRERILSRFLVPHRLRPLACLLDGRGRSVAPSPLRNFPLPFCRGSPGSHATLASDTLEGQGVPSEDVGYQNPAVALCEHPPCAQRVGVRGQG